MKRACKCYPRASVDGACTEWSCPYHGRENQRLQLEQRATCPIHRRHDDKETRDDER